MDDDEEPILVPLANHVHGGDAQDEQSDKLLVSVRKTFDKAVPVTLVTGFLGAGKSTLIRHILTQQHGYRVAVILNDFGAERGIDKALLQDVDGGVSKVDEWVELTNGCLCCSVKDDFVNALESLMLQQHVFDYILIETTGLANPGPIAAALWTDEELEAGVVLDAIVTVVDAKNVRTQLSRVPADASASDAHGHGAATVNEAQRQVAYADVILLNKTDLVEEAELAHVTARLRAHNEAADVVPCTCCEVPLERLLDRGGYRAAQTHAQVAALDASQRHEASPAAPCGHENCAPDSCEHTALKGAQHDHTVSSVALRLEEPLLLEQCKRWLDSLLWEEAAAADIYRIKGILSVAGSDRMHVVQAVHDVYDILEAAPWPAGAERLSRLVVIGRHLSQSELMSSLTRAVHER